MAAIARGARVERWRRIALASVKQSRRAVLPEILTPLTFDAWLRDSGPELRLMFVEPGLEGNRADGICSVNAPSSAAVIVGPEGGWTLLNVRPLPHVVYG